MARGPVPKRAKVLDSGAGTMAAVERWPKAVPLVE